MNLFTATTHERGLTMFLQSIQDHPIMYTVALGLVVLCVFAWTKAMKASRRRQAQRNAIITELEREKALRQEFKTPTQQQLEDTSPARLLEGLCAHVQLRLEKEDDMEVAFHALPEPARFAYALGYVVQDSREQLSEFFRKNDQPLTGVAMQAVDKLIGDEFAESFRAQYEAFDENNETVSLIESAVEASDIRFSALTEQLGDELYMQAKNYFLANFVIFTNIS